MFEQTIENVLAGVKFETVYVRDLGCTVKVYNICHVNDALEAAGVLLPWSASKTVGFAAWRAFNGEQLRFALELMDAYLHEYSRTDVYDWDLAFYRAVMADDGIGIAAATGFSSVVMHDLS